MIEATEPLSTIETHRLWEGILASVNYDFTLYDGLNRFYLASEKEDLQPALVFLADNYTRATEIWTWGAIEIENLQLKQRTETLEPEIGRLRASPVTASIDGGCDRLIAIKDEDLWPSRPT
jgi:hypothetical protein